MCSRSCRRRPSGATAMPLTSSGAQSGKLILTSTSLRMPLPSTPLDDIGRVAQAGFPERRLAAARFVGLRQRERGNAEQRAFHGAGHGAGIDHVLADIAAAIDAGQHEIDLLAVEHVAHAHDDAIGRRAAHRVAAVADLAQPQRIVERQRMRDARLIVLRRDDPDIVGQRARDLGADIEAFGVNAVVVGDQNAHASFRFYLLQSAHIGLQRGPARRSSRRPPDNSPSPRSARGRRRRRSR